MHADIGLCSGSTDEKVKGWDTTRAVCITTAKLSGAVLAIAPSDYHRGILLCALDKPEMQLVDMRSQNCGVVGTCTTGEHVREKGSPRSRSSRDLLGNASISASRLCRKSWQYGAARQYSLDWWQAGLPLGHSEVEQQRLQPS